MKGGLAIDFGGCRVLHEVKMMDGWEYPRRKARAYHVCKGCTNSWIWNDRISSTRWGCTKCGAAWPQSNDNWRTDWSPKKKANLRGRPRHQVAPPPGLGGKTKQQKSEVEQTLRQAWSSLPTECQQALKGMGLDFTPEPEPQPLEELLKAHLESLPKEVKEVVEGLYIETCSCSQCRCHWPAEGNCG